jgi:transcriptional regulator with XRE-family HTH domain
MNLVNRTSKQPDNRLGGLLSHWRLLRRKSRATLALDAGVSQRHIGFIESGRSIPSRQVLVDIVQALDIPFRNRNELLLSAGHAPLYSESVWSEEEMQIVVSAATHILRQHDPYPAVLMDRYWNVLMTNHSTPRFFNCFVDLAACRKPPNALHLMFDPKGLRPFIANWEEVRESLLQRVYRESVGRAIDEEMQALIDALLAYPQDEHKWKSPRPFRAASNTPVIPISLTREGKIMNYFSMVTFVGTPKTIAAEELRIECMFPADEFSAIQYLKTIGKDSALAY